jgi:hypothetical protein
MGESRRAVLCRTIVRRGHIVPIAVVVYAYLCCFWCHAITSNHHGESVGPPMVLKLLEAGRKPWNVIGISHMVFLCLKRTPSEIGIVVTRLAHRRVGHRSAAGWQDWMV